MSYIPGCHTLTFKLARLCCGMWKFCCILISRFHIFPVFYQGVSKLNFHRYLISQLYPTHKIRENFMHVKTAQLAVSSRSILFHCGRPEKCKDAPDELDLVAECAMVTVNYCVFRCCYRFKWKVATNMYIFVGLAIEDVISAKIVYDEYLKQNTAGSQIPSFLSGINKL